MYKLTGILTKIKSVSIFPNHVVCVGESISIYNNQLELEKEICDKPWATVALSNHLLFQSENGKEVKYITLSDASFHEHLLNNNNCYLFKAWLLDNVIAIPTDQNEVQIFDADLNLRKVYEIAGLPKLILEDTYLKIHGSVIHCYQLEDAQKKWELDVAQSTVAATWKTKGSVIIQTQSSVDMGVNKLIWLDTDTGQVKHERLDAMHMMQRIEDDIYILAEPFSEHGYLKIISLIDATTKLNLPVQDLFAPYAHLHNIRADNFQYLKVGAFLYILHFRQKGITIFNLNTLKIVDHFCIETTAYHLRELYVNECYLFVLDDQGGLHIFERVA